MNLGQLIEEAKKLKEKRKQLDILIQEAKNKGMDTSLPQVTLTVLEEVIPIALGKGEYIFFPFVLPQRSALLYLILFSKLSILTRRLKQ